MNWYILQITHQRKNVINKSCCISHFTMKPITLQDYHGPEKPPQTKYPSIEHIEEDNDSDDDENDTDINPCNHATSNCYHVSYPAYNPDLWK